MNDNSSTTYNVPSPNLFLPIYLPDVSEQWWLERWEEAKMAPKEVYVPLEREKK